MGDTPSLVSRAEGREKKNWASRGDVQAEPDRAVFLLRSSAA